MRVHVCDSGKGITPDEIPQLCNKFGKLFRTAEINSEGIGLGLMISKALVDRNGGRLEIHSKGIDRGSTFAFSMQMSEVNENELSVSHHIDENRDEVIPFGDQREEIPPTYEPKIKSHQVRRRPILNGMELEY